MTPTNAKVIQPPLLPRGLHCIERGWLSANTVVALDENRVTLIDSGYHTHTSFLQAALQGLIGQRRVDAVYNTHLHSDHCGGNAWLADHYDGICISIPQTAVGAYTDWSQAQAAYDSVGQTCPAFTPTAGHSAGDVLHWGGLDWRVIASPGHDNDSVMFFCEDERILMSADALWENGFGALFPLIEGFDAIGDQLTTLDLIESLGVRTVIPGHGSVFTEVNRALDAARSRLASFAEKPDRTLHNTFRVLVKFNLLEWQRLDWNHYRQRFAHYAAIRKLAAQVLPPQTDLLVFADGVADALVKAGVARWDHGHLVNQ